MQTLRQWRPAFPVYRPSGILFAFEIGLCFVPLAWFSIALFGVVAVGLMPVTVGLVNLTASLCGPLGLVCGASLLVGRRPLARHWYYLLLILAGWTTILQLSQLAFPALMEAWREFILISLFPLLGSTHLALLRFTERE